VTKTLKIGDIQFHANPISCWCNVIGVSIPVIYQILPFYRKTFSLLDRRIFPDDPLIHSRRTTPIPNKLLHRVSNNMFVGNVLPYLHF
jgi:hypothetical protein